MKQKIDQENLKHWSDYFAGRGISEKAPYYIKKAGKVIRYANLEKEEQAMIDAFEKAQAIYDAESVQTYYEGFDKGREEGKKELILKMKALGCSSELIAQVVDLPPKKIKELLEDA